MTVWSKASFAALSSLVAGSVAAVNLVPNPGFETSTSCPDNYSQLALATPWHPPTDGTSDYLNSCNPGLVGVPDNGFGTRAARQGEAYAGVYVYHAGGAHYREYLQVTLDQPLVAGVEYEVSMYVALASRSRWAVETFGAYLSVGPVGPVAGWLPLPFTPQVANTSGTLSSSDWFEIRGRFVAVGGEDHIVIGNFSNDGDSGRVEVNASGLDDSYYYVEDVSLSSGCAAPMAEAGPEREVCAGETVTLDGSASLACDAGGLEYRWLDGATEECGWSSLPQCDVTPSVSASYTLEVRCLGGCTEVAVDTVVVIVVPAVRPADLGNSVRAVRDLADVLMSWSSDPNAASYNLYRGVDKRVWPAPLVTGLGATTTALPDVFGPLDLYFYRLTGVSCSDLEGP